MRVTIFSWGHGTRCPALRKETVRFERRGWPMEDDDAVNMIWHHDVNGKPCTREMTWNAQPAFLHDAAQPAETYRRLNHLSEKMLLTVRANRKEVWGRAPVIEWVESHRLTPGKL